MHEEWKKVEKGLNEKEAEIRAKKASAPITDLPPELQQFVTETITNEVELTGEELILAELRLDNVKKAARAFHQIDKRKERLQSAKFEFEKRFQITSGKNRPPQIIEAMRKIDDEIIEAGASINELMQSNPEAYIVRNALELRKYRKQLKESDFVLTPYGERKLQELGDNYYSMDKVPFLNGETGSGKSSIAKYFCKEVLRSDSERIAGTKGIDETKIFGKISLTSDEKGPQAVFIRGPLYAAMEKGVPLIIEEVNAIPPEILKSLNDIIINAKKGDEVPVIGDPHGSRIKAKPGFGVIMTGNLNRNPKAIDRYKGLFELSADFVNRVRPVDYDYLPQSTEGNHIEEAGKGNELYTLMIAMIMNDKGDLNAPEGALDGLWRLAKFTRKIQEVYSGQRDGKLFSRQAGLEVPVAATSSVVSMRDIKQTIESWKRDNFKNELDYYIYKELIAPLTNAMDTRFFVQQLQAEGFLADESWKNVVARAGTFDSAIHAPENTGKELEFMTVRNVVENVYGKAPERKDVPFDLEIKRKSEWQIYIINRVIKDLSEKVDWSKKFRGSDRFSEETLASLDEIIEVSKKFVDDFKKAIEDFSKEDIQKDVRKFVELNNILKESLEVSENLQIIKTKDIVEQYSRSELDERDLVRKGIAERSLDEGIRKTYTENFVINETFIATHKRILEKINEAEAVLGTKENGEPRTIVELSKEIVDLEVELAVTSSRGGDPSSIKPKLDQLASTKAEYLKLVDRALGAPREFKYEDTYYLNLSGIIQGAEADMIYNVDQLKKDGKFERRYQEEIVDRMNISMGPGVNEIFSNSTTFFKNQEDVTLQRFYEEKFYHDEKLRDFNVSIDDIKRQLDGFVYSEPWMILGFIYREESWMLGADSIMGELKELFKDRVIFCVKRDNGEDALISVFRKGDCDWEISVLEGDNYRRHSTKQFIAPKIINPERENKERA